MNHCCSLLRTKKYWKWINFPQQMDFTVVKWRHSLCETLGGLTLDTCRYKSHELTIETLLPSQRFIRFRWISHSLLLYIWERLMCSFHDCFVFTNISRIWSYPSLSSSPSSILQSSPPFRQRILVSPSPFSSRSNDFFELGLLGPSPLLFFFPFDRGAANPLNLKDLFPL